MNIPLNIDWQQILLHLMNFVILAGGLYFLLYKPVKAFMDKRAAYYQEQADQAAQTTQAAQQLKADYEARLSAADDEIREEKKQAQKDAAAAAQQQLDAAKTYAQNLGLAFQIRDDMLDVIGDEATFGKPIGSDKAEKKTTFVDLLGLAACEREVVRLTDEAISALGLFGGEADFLAALSHSMETRNK